MMLLAMFKKEMSFICVSQLSSAAASEVILMYNRDWGTSTLIIL